MVCGPPRGDLELSDCLRHCLDEDGVVNGSVVSVEDMATSLSVDGMEREERDGRSALSSKFREILARLARVGQAGALAPHGTAAVRWTCTTVPAPSASPQSHRSRQPRLTAGDES